MLANAAASVHITVQNDASAAALPTRVRLLICDANHSVVASGWAHATAIGAGSQAVLDPVELPLEHVRTWSPQQPALHYVMACLEADCTAAARSSIPTGAACPTAASNTAQVRDTFGVRTFSFSSSNGLRLNGRPLKLRGGCVQPHGSHSASRFIALLSPTLKACVLHLH
jgi:beta-galactosidase/beta-glucuronidase